MDLYVRIPATNMHDVGIQTIPSDTSNEGHPLRKEEHLGSHDNQKQVLTDHKDKDRPTSLPNQISSQCDPATLTLRMGESEWCIERSTPRKASENPQPLSPRDKGRDFHDNFGDSEDRNSTRAVSTFQSRVDHLDLGMDLKLHLITSELGVSDWMKGREHAPLDVGKIKFVSPDIRSVERDSRSESCPSVVSNISGRSLNEPLDKYMVIRQRTFHGLPRSKKELRVLPLTDPRENNQTASRPSWLYRSKTDLFIERRRSKIAATRRASCKKARHSWNDLDGMTFAGLMETLPSVNQSYETGEVVLDVNNNRTETAKGVANCSGIKSSTQEDGKLQTKNSQSDSRLPPISLKPNQQQVLTDCEEKASAVSPRKNSGTSSSGSDSSVQNEDKIQDTSKQQFVRGKLRKQSLAAIPLRLWEPSFDCVVVSSRKILQPRHLVKTWALETPTRQQPSPLK